jgi:drug/metabolite transporter (DMT)-like permease
MTTAGKGHIGAIITITIWSSTFIISKMILSQATPFQVLIARFVLAILFLTLLSPRWPKWRKFGEELLFLGIGTALALYFFFENSALQRTYSANVSLIVAIIPLMTGALSAWINKSRFFTLRSVIGSLIAYLGVLLVILSGSRLAGLAPVGDLLALGAAVMFSAYSILMEKVKGYTLIQLTRKVFVYALAVLVLLALISRERLVFTALSLELVAGLLFLGIVASSLAFLLWNKAINAIGPALTNQYIYLIPVITTILSAIVLDERITLVTVSGALLILTGLYLSEHRSKSAD